MVREHRQQLMQLRSLADADLRALLQAISGESVAGVRDALIEALPELIAPYATASGELAAVLFEDLRAEAGRRGVFYVDTVELAPAAGKVEATARWAVAPLADEALEATVQTRLSGALGRIIMDGSRDTMMANGARESVRFQRMPRPGCCAFCGMLASRPAWMAYKSAASASGVVGRGSTRTGLDADGKRLSGGVGGGINARGSRELGAATHDSCHCVVVPLYPGTEMASLAATTRESYQKKYQQALTNEDGKQLTSPSEILAEWRRYHGTR